MREGAVYVCTRLETGVKVKVKVCAGDSAVECEVDR